MEIPPPGDGDLTYALALQARAATMEDALKVREAQLMRLWAQLQRQEALATHLALHWLAPDQRAHLNKRRACLSARAAETRLCLERARARTERGPRAL